MMSNVIAFTPRPRPPEPAPSLPLAGIDLRAHLEEAAQTALDAADKIIAALDRIEDTGDEADPAVRLAEGACETAIARAREADPEPEPPPQEAALAEPEGSESDLEEIAEPEPYPERIHLPWRGAGNVVAAAGCAVLALVARA